MFLLTHHWSFPSVVWSEWKQWSQAFAGLILAPNYQADPTHGCYSPHSLLPHQYHPTARKTAASSWNEAGRSAPAAFPNDGSFGMPCHLIPSAPTPLVQAAPSVPGGFHCHDPVFHPKQVQDARWKCSFQTAASPKSYVIREIPIALKYFKRLEANHGYCSKWLSFH